NGSAGIEYVKEINSAFITSGCVKNFGHKNIQGSIFLYEFHDKNKHYEAKKLSIAKPYDRKHFTPFGISSFVSKGRVILYVVNNYYVPSTIEVFQYDPAAITLRHRKTIRSPMFKNLVDIVVVGADRFIVTSFVYNSYRSLQLLELAMQTPLGSLIYYDGKKSNYLERYFPTPSGLAIDKRNEILYVASTTEEIIRVYHFKKDMTISHQVDVNLLTSPINIFVDTDDDLWISAQPVNYKALQHLSYPIDPEYRSPSQVLRVKFQKDHKSWIITEPYANDGATLWGSSSVIFVKDQLLIGSLFGRLLHCNVDYPQLA
uniref:Arylesterase n=1 Tax=Syphacia muris TaxID=451379 RepID=A0A0N5AKU0_9BILA